jgi:hypothetical protein
MLAAWLAPCLAQAAAILPGGCDRGRETEPWRRWEVTFESGYLWNVGSNTPLDYEIAPTQVSFRGPAHFERAAGGRGGLLVLRPRFSLLLESIVEGPEDHYFGLAAAPSAEWWLPSGRTSLFFSVGGGVGWINSTREAGGQGQDFTLNWFAHLGVRHELRPQLSLLAGVYFLHHSNGGRTDPNPGIDALGFTIGAGWRF